VHPLAVLAALVTYKSGRSVRGGTWSPVPKIVDALDAAFYASFELVKHRVDVDTFVIYTDNETWAGPVHPAQALRAYREARGIPAKLVVVGMTSTGFSIADPNDAGMLDVVGFDTSTPPVIADFARA
jgi:hypothetical protein